MHIAVIRREKEIALKYSEKYSEVQEFVNESMKEKGVKLEFIGEGILYKKE